MRRTKVSFDTALCRKVEDDGHEMPSASLVRRCRHLMALQTTCSVFGARGLQTHRATGAHGAPGKIASSSYLMKARDLTSGLPALPVGLSEILQTANQRSAKSRSHTKPTPEADAPNERPAERQIFFTPGFLRYLGDVPKNSRKIQGRVCRVFYL